MTLGSLEVILVTVFFGHCCLFVWTGKKGGEKEGKERMERLRDLERVSRLAQEMLFSSVPESCMNLALGTAVSFSHLPTPTSCAYIDMAQKPYTALEILLSDSSVRKPRPSKT